MRVPARAVGALLLGLGNVAAGALVLILGCLELVTWGFIILRAPRRAWAKHEGGGERLEFSDVGVHVETANINSMHQWALYPKVIERDGLYLLMIKGGRAYRIFPKRAFTSMQDEARFRLLVQDKAEARLAVGANEVATQRNV